MFKVVYADPPWTYKDSGSARAADSKYPVMSNYDIMRLPVEHIVLPDAFCFLWVTSPLLPEGIATLEAWGFRYVTKAFTWVKMAKNGKPKLGMGHYTRANSEDCLLGVRGRPHRVNAGVSQVVIEPLGKHSQKPDTVRERIVTLTGDCPRIELFARQRHDGWSALGFDVGTGEITKSLWELSNV